MKRKKIIKKLNYQPTKLQKHHLKKPFEILEFFFRDFPIHETRDNLWELYKGWIYHSSEYANEEITRDMLCFYTQFCEFVNACYLYTASKKDKNL